MEGKTIGKNIFKYIVFLMLAAGIFVIVRYYTKPAKVDTGANKDITLFMQNTITDINQRLKSGPTGEDIATWLSWQKSNAALYDEAEKNKDKAIKEQSKVLKDLIVKVQVRDFPEFRDAYVKLKKEVLAKQNIEIVVSGVVKDTLTFKGAVFEPTHTKKQFLKDINQIVKDLRFKDVVFKWSEKADGDTDYEIKSKDDAEI